MQMTRQDATRIISSHARTARQHLGALSTLQRLYACLFFVILVAFTAIFIIYHTAIFAFIQSIKADLVNSSWKWTLLVALTAACSIPPLIGYASSVTLAGYVFGFFRGWAISLLGSLLGAGLAFIIYRYFLSHVATRMSAQNRHFAALTKALDGAQGWTLLVMIRLCPFPFSLSNAALATIPSITLPRFMGATFLGGLRLSVHAFVGSRLADLTDNPDADRKSRIVSTVGIVAGILIGAVTGYAVYIRTKAISNRLASNDGNTNGRTLDEEDDFDVDAQFAHDEQDALLAPKQSRQNGS